VPLLPQREQIDTESLPTVNRTSTALARIRFAGFLPESARGN